MLCRGLNFIMIGASDVSDQDLFFPLLSDSHLRLNGAVSPAE